MQTLPHRTGPYGGNAAEQVKQALSSRLSQIYTEEAATTETSS
jgi:hypothetical protein